MRNYIDILSNIFLTRQKELEDGSDRLSENIDKFIIWIISLSTGSIALIFASFGRLEFMTIENLRLPIILLMISIISAVLGRTFSSISSYIGYQLNSLFAFGLRTFEIPYQKRELVGNEAADLIYLYFKSDFEIDFPIILESLAKLEGDEIEKYNKQVRQFYLDYLKSRSNEMDHALGLINMEMIDSFGLKKYHFVKHKAKSNRFKGIVMRFSNVLQFIFYWISMFAFIVAIIQFLIKTIL